MNLDNDFEEFWNNDVKEFWSEWDVSDYGGRGKDPVFRNMDNMIEHYHIEHNGGWAKDFENREIGHLVDDFIRVVKWYEEDLDFNVRKMHYMKRILGRIKVLDIKLKEFESVNRQD